MKASKLPLSGKRKNSKKTAQKRDTLTIAPPGCGKTYALTKKLQEFIQSDDKEDILCITFTRQAAREMKTRIREAIKLRSDSLPVISTLHSFCTTVLGENDLLGEPFILDNDDSLLDSCAAHVGVKRVSSRIDGFRDITLQTIQLYSLFLKDGREIPDYYVQRDRKRKEKKKNKNSEGSDNPAPPPEGLTREEFILTRIERYEEFKKAHSGRRQCLDFNDILFRMKTAILKGEYTHRFRRILVDEVQDLNDFQMDLIRMLCAEDGSIDYFGDPQQSIYSFMGARAEMIASLAHKCNHVSKNINYRSADYLVHFFNQYSRERQLPLKGLSRIMPSWEQVPRHKSHMPEDGLSLVYAESEAREIDAITSILYSLPNTGRELSAILTRNRAAVDRVISSLTTMHRFLVIDPTNDYHSTFLRYLRAHLRVCRNPSGAGNWKELIKYFCCMGSEDSATRVFEGMEAHGVTPQDLAFRVEGTTLEAFHDCVSSPAQRGVLAVVDIAEDGGPRVLIEDLATKERFTCPLSEKELRKLPFWKKASIPVFIEDNAASEAQSRHLYSLMETLSESHPDVVLFRVTEIERLIRLSLLYHSDSSLGELPSNEDPLDALREKISFLDTFLSTVSETDGGHAPKKSVLQEQQDYLSLMGIRTIRHILYTRYRPVFDGTIRQFREIDGSAPFYKYSEWLLLVHKHLIAQRFVQDDGFGFMTGAKNAVFHHLRRLEILRHEITYSELVKRKILKAPEDAFWKQKDRVHLDNLQSLQMEQYRNEAPEAFQKEKDIRRERLDELQSVLSELRTADLIPYMSLPIIPVIVTTVHQSKGQEYDNVFLFNSINSMYMGRNGASQKEEDRIFYVGLTRARRRIVISYSDTPSRNRPIKALSWGRVQKRDSSDPKAIIQEMLENLITCDNKEMIIDCLMKKASIKGKLEEKVPHIANRPHLVGTITIDKADYEIAAWINYKADGTIALKLSDRKSFPETEEETK